LHVYKLAWLGFGIREFGCALRRPKANFMSLTQLKFSFKGIMHYKSTRKQHAWLYIFHQTEQLQGRRQKNFLGGSKEKKRK